MNTAMCVSEIIPGLLINNIARPIIIYFNCMVVLMIF